MMRNKGLDLLRILSALAVVIIHCNAVFYKNCSVSAVLTYRIEMVINLITRFSVPCFIMISGAFLLENDKNCDARYFYKKSLKKLLIPYIGMVLFWIVFSLVRLLDGSIGVLKFFCLCFTGTYGNLWFMPMLIGLYVLTPFFIRLRKSIDQKYYMPLFLLWMLWAIISQSTSIYNLPYSIGVIVAYGAYFFGGYVLKQFCLKPLYIFLGGGGVYIFDFMFNRTA